MTHFKAAFVLESDPLEVFMSSLCLSGLLPTVHRHVGVVNWTPHTVGGIVSVRSGRYGRNPSYSMYCLL